MEFQDIFEVFSEAEVKKPSKDDLAVRVLNFKMGAPYFCHACKKRHMKKRVICYLNRLHHLRNLLRLDGKEIKISEVGSELKFFIRLPGRFLWECFKRGIDIDETGMAKFVPVGDEIVVFNDEELKRLAEEIEADVLAWIRECEGKVSKFLDGKMKWERDILPPSEFKILGYTVRSGSDLSRVFHLSSILPSGNLSLFIGVDIIKDDFFFLKIPSDRIAVLAFNLKENSWRTVGELLLPPEVIRVGP